ncbi:uncharacterized protein LOC101855283 [Aplysia californica]|uniref:Uncharacterized protein LOC101855283 n=1 Tax=Aplysia californica TaxID=6500 RepID=A0ABM0K0K6_APLCA|nr:uncharacterized protein LOC101855283 [Aplysia californica]
MSRMSVTIQASVMLCVLLLITSGVSAAYLPREVRSYDRPSSCSRNTPCLWALCVWSQYVTVDPDSCMFIPSGCKCPRGQRCRRTLDVTPNNGYLTVPFTCQ